MIENLKLGFKLFIITSLSALFLSVANHYTKDAIAENSKITKEDLNMFIPGAVSINDYKGQLEGNILEINKAMDKDELLGYIFKVKTKGFHGDIELLIGISKEHKLGGIKVLSHSETPGLGAKITEKEFQEKFNEKNILKGINIVKSPSSKEEEVEAISGATITSKSIGVAVNEVIKYYRVNINSENIEDIEGDLEAVDATSGASSSE